MPGFTACEAAETIGQHLGFEMWLLFLNFFKLEHVIVDQLLFEGDYLHFM
jgi:hypothetical protein